MSITGILIAAACVGIVGFLSCDALRLGSTWVLMLMLMLCIAIIVLDLIGLLSFRGK